MDGRSGNSSTDNNNQSVYPSFSFASAQPHEIITPFAPIKIKIADLQADGRLLSAEDVERVIKFVERQKNSSDGKRVVSQKKGQQLAARFQKNEIGIQFSIIVFADLYFAIYRGVKQDCHLGAGGFGYAKLVQDIKTGEWAVLKLSEALKSEDHEFELLQKIDMGIGQLDRIAGNGSEFIKAQRRLHPHYWMSNQTNMVMKLATGVSFAELDSKNYALSDVQLLEIIIQMFQSYQVLVDKNIIHGDLKLSNMIYDFITNKVKIIDFGVSAKKQWLRSGVKRSLVVTGGFDAPELKYIEGQNKYLYTVATDMYALGKTIIYLLRNMEEDRSCSRIENEILRRQILKFCEDNLCHHEALRRPSCKDAMNYFDNLQKQQLVLLPHPFRKITLLCVEEYRNLLNQIATIDNELLNQAQALPPAPIPVAPSLLPAGVDRFYQRVKVGLGHLFSFGSVVDNTIQMDPLNDVDPVMTQGEQLKAKQAKLLQVLKQFDEVWLVDGGRLTDKEYIEIRQQLELACIHVGSRCFVNQGNSFTQQMGSVMSVLRSEKQVPWQKYFCVTTNLDGLLENEKLSESLLAISVDCETDLNSVIHAIKDFTESDMTQEYHFIIEELRSIAKYYEGQPSPGNWITHEINSVVNLIQKSFETHQLTYEWLVNTLDKLKTSLSYVDVSPEPAMKHQISFHALFGSKNRNKPDSVCKVEQIEEQLKNWANP